MKSTSSKSHMIKLLHSRNIIFFVFAILLVAVMIELDSNSKEISNVSYSLIETEYLATSPKGSKGGTALPASCESGVWNNNSGYHLVAPYTDPGTCAIPVVSGICGTSSGIISNTPPSTNLCQSGTPTTVTTGASTYTWTCTGSGGGATSPTCSAPRNTAPGTPTVSGTNTGTTGVTKNNTVSATDPQAQSLYYQIDWDGNGTVDGTTGTAASGAAVAIGNIYYTAGTYSVRARAVDTMGLISPWSAIFSITITTPVVGSCGTANGIAVAAAPTSNLCQSGTPTAVSGTGPFTWTCTAPGGNSPICSAPIFNCEAGVLNPGLSIVSSNSLIGATLNSGIRWFHSVFSNGNASCFRNTSSNNYFVPTATQMERDAFMNNLPDGVIKGGF